MRMSKKKEIVPRLRFPEFVGRRLKITKLGRISSIVAEKAGENKYTLMSVTSGVGLVPQAEKFGREIAGDSYKNYIVIKKYDFAYNKSATKQFPEGYISMLEEYDIAAVPNSIFTCFRIIDSESYPPFFDYLFNNNYHGHWLKKYIEVGARVHGALSIDTNHLWSMPLVLPDFKEQQKIADCLSSIDELIDAESRKLKALEKYKRGLMQKLFPAEGKTLPEWRFPEFQNQNAWSRSLLGDLLDVLMCKRIFSNETSETEDIPFYKIGTLGEKADSFISRSLFEKYKKTYRFPRQGEILISCSGTIGRCLPYDGEDAYFQDSNIVWLDNPTSLISNELLFYLLSNVHWNKLNSTTITRIYTSDLKKLVLIFPEKKEEQQKIADCLSEIDTIITEQSNKIEQLKAHKKGLMQGLFPSLKEADV